MKRLILSGVACMGITAFQTADAAPGPVIEFYPSFGMVYFYVDGVPKSSFRCPQEDDPHSPVTHQIWLACLKEELLEDLGPTPGPVGIGVTARPKVQSLTRTASANSGLALNSSTPYLPFLGNQLVVVSYLPNATVAANATAAYSVGLRRQSDCSLMEDFVQPGATTPDTPNGDYVASLPAAQDYFHQLSGLATSPDVFAQGCAYSTFGQPSLAYGVLLGETASGAIIGATVRGSLVVTLTDATANTFTNTTLLSSASNPDLSAATAGPLTSSGNMDLVVTFATDPANSQLSTAVLLGNGDGTFKSAVYYDIPGDATIDDVNGDGIPDIVVCGSTPGITTLIGSGTGTFTPSALSATTIGSCGGAAGVILTGDFNSDGKKDLLVNGVVLLGQGNGTFTVGSPVTVQPLNFSSSIAAAAVGDMNKDGKLDVVVSQPGFVALFYGNGDGTFTAGPHYAALPDYMQVSITDVDGDGNPDVILGTSAGGMYASGCCSDTYQPPLFQILMNRGNGTFVDSVAYPQGHYGNGLYTVAGPQIATADFDGDGKTDSLVFDSGSLIMLPGNGAGTLGTPVSSPVSVSPRLLVAADMNNDGKADVVVGTSTGVSILLNQGNGTFAGEQDYVLPSPAVSVATGDFNGDGRKDVAAGVNPGLGLAGASGVYVLLGLANGTYAPAVQVDASLNPTGLAAADINGDGRADLVVADQGFFDYAGATDQVNGAVHVYLGNASGSFTASTSPITAATNYSVAMLGDLNGDGKQDLILGGNVAGAQDSSTPSVYTLVGNGDGTFQAAIAASIPSNYGIGTTSIALADFNNDGHLDVVVGDATAMTSVLLGNGDGSLAPTILTLGQQPFALAAGDLNADGFPELLVGTNDPYGNANLSVFLNANSWTAAVTLPATTTTLMSSAASIPTGQSLTLTATIAPASGTTVPTGTATFLDGGTTLGTSALDASGMATYSTTTLTAGTHLLTASYGGSATFAGSASSAITVTVTAASPDFTVALNPTSGSVTRGLSATTTVTLTPIGGFNQMVSLTCSGLPDGASCGFSPASVTVNGSAATSTLTISTAAAMAMTSTGPRYSPMAPGGLLLVGFLALPMVWRQRRAVTRNLRGTLLALLCMGGATLLQSCSGGGGYGGGSGGTPAGTYTITVTATVGSTSHAATYKLTVN